MHLYCTFFYMVFVPFKVVSIYKKNDVNAFIYVPIFVVYEHNTELYTL